MIHNMVTFITIMALSVAKQDDSTNQQTSNLQNIDQQTKYVSEDEVQQEIDYTASENHVQYPIDHHESDAQVDMDKIETTENSIYTDKNYLIPVTSGAAVTNNQINLNESDFDQQRQHFVDQESQYLEKLGLQSEDESNIQNQNLQNIAQQSRTAFDDQNQQNQLDISITPPTPMILIEKKNSVQSFMDNYQPQDELDVEVDEIEKTDTHRNPLIYDTSGGPVINNQINNIQQRPDQHKPEGIIINPLFIFEHSIVSSSQTQLPVSKKPVHSTILYPQQHPKQRPQLPVLEEPQRLVHQQSQHTILQSTQRPVLQRPQRPLQKQPQPLVFQPTQRPVLQRYQRPLQKRPQPSVLQPTQRPPLGRPVIKLPRRPVVHRHHHLIPNRYQRRQRPAHKTPHHSARQQRHRSSSQRMRSRSRAM